MSKDSLSTAIIIPAYNEASVIGKTLDELLAALKGKRFGNGTRIIVINDGSSDKTIEVVGNRKNVILISHILNSGAGAATRTGLNFARDTGADYVVAMDADGQHDSKDAAKVLGEIMKNQADLVIGSRLIVAKGMPWYRVLGNQGLSLFTFMLFGVLVKDSQSGLRGFNKKALNSISFHSNNFTFNSELMWRAGQQHLRIKEIPIKAIYTDYSLAKGQSNWNVIHIVRQLIKRRLLEFFN